MKNVSSKKYVNFTKKQVEDASKKARNLVKGVDEEYKQTTYSAIFTKLLTNSENGNNEKETSESVKKEVKLEKISKGPKFYVTELVQEGFFNTQRSIVDILEELEKRSHHYKQGDITRPFESLCHDKILRRERKKNNNKRALWFYSNW